MKQILEYLENRIQALVERSIHLIPGQYYQTLTIDIIHGLRDRISYAIGNDEDIPNIFSIYVHPTDFAALQIEPQWLTDVKKIIVDAVSESHHNLPGEISIELIADEEVQRQKYRLESFSVRSVIEQTSALKVEVVTKFPPHQTEKNSYLLMQDQSVFTLGRGILQIGRRKDNNIVIEHPTISRNHAQIRYIRGQYIIFDLNSTSGTYVNGIKIRQAVLQPGDVITLAGFSLIYIEEGIQPDSDQEQTSQIPRKVDPS